MQTLLAYALAEAGPGEVTAGLRRVEEWYAPLWRRGHRHGQVGSDRCGLHLWYEPDDGCRWPAWSAAGDRAVATLHVPLGFQGLLGPGSPDTAPARLLERLRARPADVFALTPPFVLAGHGPDGRLTLFTDALGVGRLYELRTPRGRVWSNRPVAALRFAGVHAEADPLAWARMAACDWPMGEATPYAGLRTLPGATRVEVGPDGHREQTLDALAHLQAAAAADPLAPAALDATAAALTGTAAEVQQLWSEPPVLSLSGGRDSRLVVAAFAAAAAPYAVRTDGALAGELATARDLLARLPHTDGHHPVEHRVTGPREDAAPTAAPGVGDPAYARARRWHDLTEGLRPAVYLPKPAPKRLLRHRPVLVAGVGGEFGHAPGFPGDVARLEQLPEARRLAGFADSLAAKVVLPHGLAPATVAAAHAQIRAVLGRAFAAGATDSRALVWFYADERLRRWGLAGESPGRVLPLLAPAFVAAGFGLSTARSEASALHRALTARLVPGWADLPYYAASLADRQRSRRTRLWEEPDAGGLPDLLWRDDWADAFDPAQVRSAWRRASTGRPTARDELLLQRVVWRAAFTDHLAAVNGQSTDGGRPDRPAVRVAGTRPPAPRRAPSLVHALAVRANDLPLARRMARTGLGRRVRRMLGV